MVNSRWAVPPEEVALLPRADLRAVAALHLELGLSTFDSTRYYLQWLGFNPGTSEDQLKVARQRPVTPGEVAALKEEALDGRRPPGIACRSSCPCMTTNDAVVLAESARRLYGTARTPEYTP